MAFKQEKHHDGFYMPPIKGRLTNSELVALDNELEKHRVYFVSRDGEEMSTIDQSSWMIERGARNEHGAIVLQNYSPAEYDSYGKCVKPVDCSPILFEQLQEDWSQWLKWKSAKKATMSKV